MDRSVEVQRGKGVRVVSEFSAQAFRLQHFDVPAKRAHPSLQPMTQHHRSFDDQRVPNAGDDLIVG
jgi:hypothetical protein